MSLGGDWKELTNTSASGTDLQLIKYHLHQGVDPNYQHPEYFTAPIFDAIRNGHLDVVRILVDEGNASLVLKEDSSDLMPMEVALEFGRHEIVDYLLDRLRRLLLLEDEKKKGGEMKRIKKSINMIRTIVITGGNRGIGYAIAKTISKLGHCVVITCRSSESGLSATSQLISETGNNKISFVVGDLSTVRSTLELANCIKEKVPNMNVLIHNAGLWPRSLVLNDEKVEMSFMVNYLGMYILNKELLPILRQNADVEASRIVMVNAKLFLLGEDPNVNQTPFGDDFSSWYQTYAKTKLCGVYHMLDLADQLQAQDEEKKVIVNAVHPGVIRTGLGEGGEVDGGILSNFQTCLLRVVKRLWKDPMTGAEVPSWLAVGELDVEKMNGLYFDEDRSVLDVLNRIRNNVLVRRDLKLWTDDFLSKF